MGFVASVYQTGRYIHQSNDDREGGNPGPKHLAPDMALRIEKAFGVNMETLLSMRVGHDAHTRRGRAVRSMYNGTVP